MGLNVSKVATNNAGRIFLAPQPLEAPQIWLNLGYDSYDGFQIPEYIEQFEDICTKDQFDSLMVDIKEHFEKHSLQPCCARYIVCSIFFPPLLLCTIPYSERRRREFDAGFDQIIRKHQRHWKSETLKDAESGSRLTSPTSQNSPKANGPPIRRDSVKKNALLRWTYGFPLPISPNKAYDSQGNELIASVEKGRSRKDEAAWPPPYYNIVFTIPQGYHYRIRNRWPGESKRSPLPEENKKSEEMTTTPSRHKGSGSPKGKSGNYKALTSTNLADDINEAHNTSRGET